MKKHTLLNLLLVLCLIGWSGCIGCGDSADGTGGAEATSSEGDGGNDGDGDEPQSLGDALSQAQEAMNQAMGGGEGGTVEPVDFRKLKDMLPEDLPGMERTNAEGQKSGMMGIKVSQAEGSYRGDDGTIDISILDMGTMKSAAMFGYAWLMAEIDRESDNGYERTTKYKGYPAFEKMERNGDRANYEFQIVVGERFIVSINGRNVTEGQVEEARDRIDFDDLDDMKDEGVSD